MKTGKDHIALLSPFAVILVTMLIIMLKNLMK